MRSPEIGVDRPQLCFVGPMLAGHAGRVPSQAETLAARFEEDGQEVMRTASVLNPVGRAGRIVADLCRRRDEFDVALVMVFSGRAFAYADLASAVARRLGKKVVLHLHGGNLPAFAARHPAWVSRVLRRGDAVVAPSAYLAEAFRTGRRDVVVIPNVIPIDEYGYRERHGARPRLLWMRAFGALYRPQMALDVVATVRERFPGATLTMAGPDEGLAATIEAQATAMGLAGCVAFPGVLDADGKRRAFADHDILLTTSSVDNAPVSVLEAGASGVPVVAASVGGLPHMLTDGENALLVADGDTRAMAGAVVRLLDDPELVLRLSRNGRVLAERSGWQRVRPRWEALLTSLATGP